MQFSSGNVVADLSVSGIVLLRKYRGTIYAKFSPNTGRSRQSQNTFIRSRRIRCTSRPPPGFWLLNSGSGLYSYIRTTGKVERELKPLSRHPGPGGPGKTGNNCDTRTWNFCKAKCAITLFWLEILLF